MPERPLLVFDGDCAFCRYCVDYARLVTGETVEYRPFQEVGDAFPEIGEEAFRSSIQLLYPDGRTRSGALAAFEVLGLGSRGRFWLFCYRYLPLFGALSECLYRFTARHRPGFHRLCRVLFGHSLQPASMALVVWLFLRLLALVYFAAFTSITWQLPGLVGDDGILSAQQYLAAVDGGYGLEKYWMLPTLLWLGPSTTTVTALGLAGILVSALLFLNLLPRLCLVFLYLLYLSLFHVSQVFMFYQWDILLLECGFLAIFLPWSPRLVGWLYRWLLFRFMLQCGLVKLLSGDPAWRNLTALQFHFETQPLPTVLAWYAHRLPSPLLEAGAVFTFAVELAVPFLMLLPRRPRQLAAAVTALFQLLIIATGSYNFFNILTLCLCLLLLDDQLLRRVTPGTLQRLACRAAARRTPAVMRSLAVAFAVTYLLLSAIILGHTGGRGSLSESERRLLTWAAPFHLANNYGVFAVMTTERFEIVFEGSRDGREWLPYSLPFKPGPVHRAPRWATPHQPRLDWQLWFAALAPREQNPWLYGLVRGLLTGSGPVLTLFQHNPFGDAPPQYVRASLYRYRYSEPEEREQSGVWWQREFEGLFWPVTAWRLQVEPTDWNWESQPE